MTSKEKELRNLCLKLADECHWESNEKLFIWIPYVSLQEFMKGLSKLLGSGLDIYVDATLLYDCVWMDLYKVFEFTDIDLHEAFPEENLFYELCA